VLIRRLEAVETLGSVQVICMDKTGTLTMNRMSVLSLYAGMERVTVADGDLFGAQGRVSPYVNDGLLRLIHVAVLCNETEVKGAQGAYVLNGTATERALMQLAINSGVAVSQLRRQYPLLKVEYRAENRNYMGTLHATEAGTQLLAVKGSPSEVLTLCRSYVKDGVKYELTEADRTAILNENERMAAEALRVLGFAYGEEGIDIRQRSLVWLGLTGMADPVRRGVKELILLFHQAGIKTVMITGDQSATAYAIGKELSLNGGGHLEILDSSHLERIDPQVLSSLVQKIDIFARISPANKLQIVQGLQRAERVVAMTGDGINDGPALKAADIGIAMGHAGTDVARGVADVILEDDNLETMIVAISQGRTIYNNIRKSVHFLMSTNLSEIAVMLSSIAAGLGQPLNPMQLLWINLLTDVFPALALSVEPPEPDVLRQSPRDPHQPIISQADLKRYGLESLNITASVMASYGYGILRYGLGPRANTLAFMTLTQAQLLHSYSCRSETHGIFSKDKLPSNRYLDLAAGGSLLLQILTVLVPGLRALLGTTPVGPVDALAIAGGAVLPFIINEARKVRDSQAVHPLPHPPPSRGREGVGVEHLTNRSITP
jgi:Ca2+-transporting ATPase